MVKAGLLKLKSTEVPIHFYKDREGRVSHHKRTGWFSPWYAAWINFKIILLYAPNFVFFTPGALSLAAGITIIIISALRLQPNFQYHWNLLGFILTIIGYSTIQLGILSKTFSDLNNYYHDRIIVFMKEKFTYDKGMLAGFSVLISGLALTSLLIIQWLRNQFKLTEISSQGILGLLLIVMGFQTIIFTFIYTLFKFSTKKQIP